MSLEVHSPPRLDLKFLLLRNLATFILDRHSSYRSKMSWTILTSSGSGSGNLVCSFQRYPTGIRAPFHSPCSARSNIMPVTRSDVMLRSSSAKIRIIFSIASPIAVEVSNCSFIEMKVTL